MEKTNNQFVACGTLHTMPENAHEIYGEKFFHFYLNVLRLSGQCDILPVTVSERLLQRQWQVGMPLAIKGQLRAYNRVWEGGTRLILTVFAQDIDEEPVLPCGTNEVYLEGTLYKAPHFRTTPFKREISDLLLAVERSYQKEDYIPCIAWGRNARFCANLREGQALCVHGRFQSRIYQKQTPKEPKTWWTKFPMRYR
jgi:primosomal replication protein N